MATVMAGGERMIMAGCHGVITMEHLIMVFPGGVIGMGALRAVGVRLAMAGMGMMRGKRVMVMMMVAAMPVMTGALMIGMILMAVMVAGEFVGETGGEGIAIAGAVVVLVA